MTRRSTAPRSRRVGATLSSLLLAAWVVSSSTGAAAQDPSGAPTTSPSAPAATSIAGTVTWNATTTSRVSPDFSDVWIVSGTMDLVLDEDLGQFMALPGKSTYAYDLEHVGCSPSTHQEGTLETSMQGFPEDGVAQALMGGPVGQDFEITVFFDDAWTVTCPPGPAGSESVVANAFPGCVASQGRMTAILEPSGTYAIACDIDLEYGIDSGVTGHIEGTLSPGPRPSSGG